MAELEARIRTAIRHRSGERADTALPTLTVGELEFDLVHHEASLHRRNVDLTAKEFEVLAYLARHRRKICTHQMILHAVWGPGYGREAHYVHAYVHRLRQKLGDDEGMIRTTPGVGYRLDPD